MTHLRQALGALAAGIIAVWGLAGPSYAQTPPTAEDYARPAIISSLSLSPDGQRLAAVTSDGQARFISIWRTESLDQAPYVIGGDARAPFTGVQFVKNDRILVFTQQLLTFGALRTFATRVSVLDMEGRPIRLNLGEDGGNQLAELQSPAIIDALPRDPQNVLIQNSRGDVLRLNVYTGRSERLERGSTRFSGYQTDLQGAVRARQVLDFDGGAVYIGQFIKHPDTGAWEEHFRWYARDREPMSIVGFTDDPNIVFVATTRGRDRAAIFEYDIRARALGEPAFEHPLFDAAGVVRSLSEEDYGEVLGFRYQGERSRVFWIDENLAAIEEGIRDALGVQTEPVIWTDPITGDQGRFTVAQGADVSVASMSYDRRRVIITKSGPSQPPEYYLLTDGSRLQLLGRSRPTIDTAALGDTRLVQYQARDGLMVPAFLTTPPASFGEGPHPAILVPHGGPWARDNLDWDPTGWTQYFASRGYVVLQPQFRGSQGWGQRIWRAGDRQWGMQMQDDKDDGARWLIEQGIAAPDRIAMHGYSYGGYAAMMAAVRPNGLYQCAIAGAGPSTMLSFQRATFESRFLREFQRPTAEGVDPLAHINDVSIPILLYHGDRDNVVQIRESEAFHNALTRAGKQSRFLSIPDMEHTLNTWGDNTGLILTEVEKFLREECGPGGL